MEKDRDCTGFCPTKSKEITIPVSYVLNSGTWEKGMGKCPHASSCSKGCPLVDAAPDELNNL